MSFEFEVLGSSSSGNAGFLKTVESKILVDAGFSGRKLTQMLLERGIPITDIDAVFITHEHTDHIAGLKGLSRIPGIQFFANQDTADAVQKLLPRPLDWKIFETGSTFAFKDLEITNFSIPHDAYDPVGYTFTTHIHDTPKTLAWVTDLGYVPKSIEEKIRKAHVLVLESNYDQELLELDEIRPPAIKQRIQGRHGHLSNDAAFELIMGMENNHNWEQVYLAHLSKHCNSRDAIENTFAPLQDQGYDYTISIVDPITHTSMPLRTPFVFQ